MAVEARQMNCKTRGAFGIECCNVTIGFCGSRFLKKDVGMVAGGI